MQRDILSAAKVVGMTLFACFISFFVYISFYVITRQIATEVTGYTIYEVTEQGVKDIETVTVLPSKIAQNQGYKEVRSPMPATATAAMSVLQVICGVGIVFCTAGSVFAKDAARDRNDADFNNAPYNRLRGLKVGLLAAIPQVILYILLLVFKISGADAAKSYYWVYRWLVMCPVKPIIDVFTGNAATLDAAPMWSVVIQGVFILLFVAFCAVMYIVCYNEDSVVAKLLYKSTRKKEKEQRRLGL